MVLLRLLERLLFCDNRLKTMMIFINLTVAWLFDRVYRSPRLVVSTMIGVYLIYGFFMNALVLQQGVHPGAFGHNDETAGLTAMANHSEVPLEERETAFYKPDVVDLPVNSVSVQARALVAQDFDKIGKALTKADRPESNSPEITAAIARAALAVKN